MSAPSLWIRRMGSIGILLGALATQASRADDLLNGFEGDALPGDAGWFVDRSCEYPCSNSVSDGVFVETWAEAARLTAYGYTFAEPPVEPPDTLWAEWHFRSNHPLPPHAWSCDGYIIVQYADTHAFVNLYGDATISHGGTQTMGGLAIDEFHTYRFESPDGFAYRISVDGVLFLQGVDDGPYSPDFIAFGGFGGCLNDQFPNMVNEWDFVRYGTLSDGEHLVSSDPPSGFVDPVQHPGFDRFTITFDQPCYVYIEDVAVQVTGGGAAPVVIQTRRLDNGPPDTVEIVLDGPLPVGETTTFTFDTGLTPPDQNVVSYTLSAPPLIPAVSEWGLVVLTLLGLAAGSIMVRRSTVSQIAG